MVTWRLRLLAPFTLSAFPRLSEDMLSRSEVALWKLLGTPLRSHNGRSGMYKRGVVKGTEDNWVQRRTVLLPPGMAKSYEIWHCFIVSGLI